MRECDVLKATFTAKEIETMIIFLAAQYKLQCTERHTHLYKHTNNHNVGL